MYINRDFEMEGVLVEWRDDQTGGAMGEKMKSEIDDLGLSSLQIKPSFGGGGHMERYPSERKEEGRWHHWDLNFHLAETVRVKANQ